MEISTPVRREQPRKKRGHQRGYQSECVSTSKATSRQPTRGNRKSRCRVIQGRAHAARDDAFGEREADAGEYRLDDDCRTDERKRFSCRKHERDSGASVLDEFPGEPVERGDDEEKPE